MTEEQKGSEVLITYVHPTLVSEYRRFGYGGLPLQGFEKLRVTGIKVRLTLTLTLALTLTLRLHRHRSPLTAHLSPLTLTLTLTVTLTRSHAIRARWSARQVH